MNRIPLASPSVLAEFPHTRGDEPALTRAGICAVHSFPTHVGMNRIIFVKSIMAIKFPHTRGDEPPSSCSDVGGGQFPHTRGDEPYPLEAETPGLKFPHTRGDEPQDMVTLYYP